MIRRMMALLVTTALLLSSFSNTEVVHADEVNTDATVFNGYEFRSYDPGADDAKLYEEAGALIYEIDKLSLEDWQNKVFIERDVVFKKGNQYTIDFSLEANKNTYFSFYVNPKGTWNPVISHTLNIGDYDEHFSFTTPVIENDMDMEILFQFGGGGNTAPLKISFLDFSIHETVVAAAEEIYKVDNFNGLSVIAEGSDDGNLYAAENGLVFETSEAGRVKIEDLNFKKGCDYEIEYSIRADKKVQAAFSLDPKGGYFTQGDQSILLSNEPTKASHKIGIQQADRQMEINFDISEMTNGELTTIVFDEIVIKEIKDGEQKNLRNAWVVNGYKLTHEESDSGIADFDIDENNNIVYKVEKFGENDWNNKVAIVQGVTFEQGNAYKVAISLETDKEIEMFFGVNPKNKWDPKVSEALLLKQGVNNFSFVTDIQAYDESMEVLLQFGGSGNTAPCNIKIKEVSIETVSATTTQKSETADESITLVKSYNFSPSNDYRFRGFVMNDSSDSELYLEQGALVYDIKTFGVNELIKNDLWLRKNCTYSVELSVSASEEMNVNYFVNEKYSQQALTKGISTIGKTVQTIKAEFRTDDNTEEQGQILLDLSGNEGRKKFYIHEVIIKTIENGTERTVPMKSFEVETDSKSNAAVKIVDDGIEYNVQRFAGNPWENKIFINTLAKFEKDKTYVVDFDMESTKDLIFTCILRNLEIDEDEDNDGDNDYFWDRNYIRKTGGDQKQHFRYTFKASKNSLANEMVFEFGGQGNRKQGPADILISDIKITECTDYRKDILQFTGSQGMFSYEHEESLASASLYQENDCLVYKIDKLGLLNWHNKIIFNQGIKFEKGYRYRIDVTASANEGTNMKFAVVSQEDWEEKVKKYKVLTNTESTISFETDKVQKYDENIEFSFDFGGMYNQDDTIIKINDIKIYKLKPEAPRKDTSIDDYDLEIVYDNSDFYESSFFNGYTFNSILLDSADASLYEQNGILHYDIREFGAETYYNKLLINDGLTVNPNKSYKIELTARADKALNFFFAINETGDEWNPLTAETVTLSGVSNTYTFITKSQDIGKDVEILFEFGANGNSGSNHVYIEDFKISENEFEVGNVDLGNGITATSDESDGGKAMLYERDGAIVYEIEKLGPEPWNNKIVTKNEFESDQNYKISFTAKATKPTKGKFVVSPTSEWVPIIEEEITLGTSLSTYSFVTSYTPPVAAFALFTPAADVVSSTMEFQFQFGGQDNVAPVTISFDDFSITQIDLVDESSVTFKGNVFSHEETGGTAKGILYTNDNNNMVYYAQKLGNIPSNNIVSTTTTMTGNKDNEIKVTVKPQKGLLINASVINATTGAELKSTTQWVGNNETKEIILAVDAQPANTDIEILVMFGQEEYADARENNNIEFTDFSVTETEPLVDEVKVIFKGNDFIHKESGETAEGILYTNASGNMVYYAQKLGNTTSDNIVSTSATITGGKNNEIKVIVRPQKGLLVNASVINTTTETELKSTTAWAGDNETKEIILSVDAQPTDTNIEILVMFGQTEYADAREDNKIEFTNFVITNSDSSPSPVTLNGYTFVNEESGDVAKGSLYNNTSGNMVYYAEKLGSADWHNKVSTSIAVENGAEYTLTVEVELDKGLNMVTTIPNATNTSNDGDAWFKNWLADNTSNTLTFDITAQSDNLEIFFQVGQDEYADAREDNRIVFKSFSLVKKEPVVLRSLIDYVIPEVEEEPEDVTASDVENPDESENSDEETKQAQEQEESGINDTAPETDDGLEDATAPDEENADESENNEEETKQEQEQEESGINNDAILETEKPDKEQEGATATVSDEGNTDDSEDIGSENNGEGTQESAPDTTV